MKVDRTDPDRTEPDGFTRTLRRVQHDFQDAERRLNELKPELLRISRQLGEIESNLRDYADALKELVDS